MLEGTAGERDATTPFGHLRMQLVVLLRVSRGFLSFPPKGDKHGTNSEMVTIDNS